MTDRYEGWQPSEEDVHDGSEGYLRYAGGVGILNNPYSEASTDLLGYGHSVESDPVAAITVAEDNMYSGLMKLIRAANPPELRTAIANMETRFAAARPHIISIVDGVHHSDWSIMRMDRMTTALVSFRPCPVEDEIIYGYFCHGRKQKLNTLRLMDGVGAAKEFMPHLEGRALAGTSKATEQRRGSKSS